MKFSTKSRYALRLMAELARYAPGSTVSLKEISERQQLSLKYLEQIVTPLARVGLVKSERGSQGGYRLTKAPADYTAGEILRAIEGSVAPIPCLGSETNECPMSDQCFTLPFWAGLDEVIERHEKSGADLTMVCTKKQKDSPFTTYVELNRKKEAVDIRVGDSNEGKCKHVSLGVYVMNRQYLIHMLSDCVTHNCIHFEREFLSRALIDGTVAGYLFNEYAVKIEDTADYFCSNMDMLDKDVRDEVFKRTRPILTRIKDEAPTYYGDEADVEDCLIADGCRIEGKVKNSVLFRDVVIEKGAEVNNCIIMEGGRILTEASLRHVITDRNVIIRDGRTMMGHENYPITIAKNATV